MVILIGIWMGIRMVLRMTVTMIPDRRINRLMYCDCRVIFATEKHYRLPERTEQHSGPLDRDH